MEAFHARDIGAYWANLVLWYHLRKGLLRQLCASARLSVICAKISGGNVSIAVGIGRIICVCEATGKEGECSSIGTVPQPGSVECFTLAHSTNRNGLDGCPALSTTHCLTRRN
jgi:hypothetical protein